MEDLQHGIIVIDKPPKISSAGVVAVVKRSLGAKKVGHAGTLDPFATGVLVCLLNRATRLAQFLVAGNKTYMAELCLGVETDTEDLTGRVVKQTPVDGITERDIHREARRWVGEMAQHPPVYSALKHEGRPLYELARKGLAVKKPPRNVTVSALDILDIRLPKVTFRVTCSQGTYIRTLGADIGRALGCGGHLTALQRTASSGFSLEDAVGLSALKATDDEGRVSRHIRPMASAMADTPFLEADEELVARIRHGKPILKTVHGHTATCDGSPVRVLTEDRQLVAVLLDTAGTDHFQYGCVLTG